MGGPALSIIICILWLVVSVILIFDAFSQTNMGCMWLALFIFVPGVSHAVYIFMRFYVNRPVERQILRQRELDEDNYPVTRFPSEIQKARYIEAASKGHGTMYSADTSLNVAPGGYRHFTDSRAEILLNQRRFEEAFEYLIDLLAVAGNAEDVRGKDTYRFYIHQIPGGPGLLKEWEFENSGRIYDVKDRSRTAPSPPDDVPF